MNSERQKWLDQLQVGDRVLIVYNYVQTDIGSVTGFLLDRQVCVHAIDIMRITNTIIFSPNGYCDTERNQISIEPYIVDYDPMPEGWARQKMYMEKIRSADYSSLTERQLESVWEVLVSMGVREVT